MIQNIIINNNAKERLDKFLAGRFSNYSRSYFQNLIEKGSVKVNLRNVKPNYYPKAGDSVEVKFESKEDKISLSPEKIKLNVVFENDDVLAINKPAGLVVHPAAGNLSGTLVNALIERNPDIKKAIFDESSDISKTRPGIVHRLDKDTSGLILVAKNKRALRSLSKQIKNRTVIKKYQAICFGWPKKNRGVLINFLGRHPKNRKKVSDIGKEKGREAISSYKVLHFLTDKQGNEYSIIEFDIKTGRTHQIRCQISAIGNPIIGDIVYGNKESIKLSKKLSISRQLLHAKEISFYLPGETKQTHLEIELPKDMVNSIKLITIK